MGRNKVTIDDNQYIIFGFDAPCNGYFAEYNDTSKSEDMALDEIGFMRGVNKNKVLDFLEKYKAIKLAKDQVPAAFNNLCLDLPC